MRLHLVDGTYELFRAHFSKRPGHLAPDGAERKATVGLASAMLSLLQEPRESVTHIAAAFDNPIRSFRNDLFDGYKTEEGVPPELLAQFDAAEEATRALGITVWSMKEHEADDAIATAAARFAPEVDQVRILTPDKDLAQCLTAKVLRVDWRGGEELDAEKFTATRGFPPEAVPDFLALVGDTADGIPGLSGFGERTAAALLASFRRLEDIPDDASRWPQSIRGAARLAATLAAERENALLYRRLATLVTDAPLAETLSQLAWKGVPRARFEAWCDALGVTSLRDRPTRWT